MYVPIFIKKDIIVLIPARVVILMIRTWHAQYALIMDVEGVGMAHEITPPKTSLNFLDNNKVLLV